ncbi:MAG: hypothetical protein AYK19_09280 [Theionarchaea archaeon DG-70-1]|nr:MAG: hypothetical protein AYK19_09280 [Theionarchaea archaeon DG-70-1]
MFLANEKVVVLSNILQEQEYTQELYNDHLGLHGHLQAVSVLHALVHLLSIFSESVSLFQFFLYITLEHDLFCTLE